jgi:hypothetical protein
MSAYSTCSASRSAAIVRTSSCVAARVRSSIGPNLGWLLPGCGNETHPSARRRRTSRRARRDPVGPRCRACACRRLACRQSCHLRVRSQAANPLGVATSHAARPAGVRGSVELERSSGGVTATCASKTACAQPRRRVGRAPSQRRGPSQHRCPSRMLARGPSSRGPRPRCTLFRTAAPPAPSPSTPSPFANRAPRFVQPKPLPPSHAR